ncbi:MAG: ABC transporter ATP-binding protein [Treponema sp.]|jgi:peptide/nickel transport system ATP-binding protein|nr:ABC transporter ATP-binding protein [Treponema sp.]
METLLQVKNLSVYIEKEKKRFRPVNNISFDLLPNEITGIVGESGCGKTLTALSIASLLPPVARAEGSILLKTPGLLNTSGTNQWLDLLQLKETELCSVRGKEISMIFQEPFSSLNPLQRIGSQITETQEIHFGKKSRRQYREGAVALMRKLGLENPEKLIDAYPFQLSGGMCQRVMIALAMILGPKILIADEPTTALDINTQEQILKLLQQINRESGTSILFISHDLGVIRQICHRVMVMYAGKIVEEGSVDEVFSNPGHEYTRSLLSALPERNRKGERLKVIPGKVPLLEELSADSSTESTVELSEISGCPFSSRCEKAEEQCHDKFPEKIKISETHVSCCILAVGERLP